MSLIATLSYMCMFESGIIGGLLFLTMFGFPGWIKMALARIRGKQYLVKLTRDNALIFEGAREEEGVYKTENGVYELEPEETFTFNGSSGALFYAPYNRSVNSKVMPLLRDLKKAGISTYSQLMYYYQTPLEVLKEQGGEEAETIGKTIQSYEGKILQELEVIKISDLKNYLESRSPAAENGIIERYISIERRKLGNPLKNSNMILMLIMAGLLGLAFGYLMGGSGDTAATGTALQGAAGGLTQLS